MNTKIIKLDINKKMFEVITAKQGDTKSRFILFNLYDGPIQFNLTDRMVRVYGKKKDNTIIFNDLVITDAKKGYCILELTNQMLAVNGMYELELVIFEGEKRLSTMPFTLNVIGSKYSEDAIVSTNEFTALMNALETVQAIENKAEKKDVENLSSQLDNIAINIFNYLDDVVVVNGKEDWKIAFDKAFSKLESGGTLVIPAHDYYISSRSVLENKNNITINCGGTIKPIDNKVPLIGVITIRNITDCVINNLNLDGNKNGITPTGKFGTHSMLCIEDSKNVIFNNLKISNTYESGVTSNGSLENIIINNVELDNIGEHGFYLSGSNINNIKFNNIKANNIGMTDPNLNRAVSVIKFRNKIDGDLLHDNIIVDGFEFNNNAINTWVDGNTRDFIQAWDCKNVIIKNGKIEGNNTCVLQTNLSIDSLTVDNVKFNGKFFAYGLKNVTGYNEPTVITEYGNCNIKFNNCNLKGYCKYISLLNFENSTIELIDNLNDDMISDDIVIPNKSCKFINCLIKPTNRRIDLKFADEIIFNNVKFLELNTGSQPLINLNLKENSNVIFENIISKDNISLFLQSSSAIFVKFRNCYINGLIKSTVNLKELEIINCILKEYRLNLYAKYDKLKVNYVYSLDNQRMDSGIYNGTIKANNTTVNLSLKYNRVDNIVLNKLLITNNLNIPFTVSCNDNILTFTIEPQTSDVVFTVFYNA